MSRPARGESRGGGPQSEGRGRGRPGAGRVGGDPEEAAPRPAEAEDAAEGGQGGGGAGGAVGQDNLRYGAAIEVVSLDLYLLPAFPEPGAAVVNFKAK